jgi:hypothetical protein
MSCPKCESDEWKLASFVHSQGLTHVSTGSQGVGVGVSSGGLGVGVGGSKTSGIHQTQSSISAAPPQRGNLGAGFAVLMALSLLLCFIFSWAWLIAAVAFAWAMYKFGIPEGKAHALAMAAWREVRQCQRCGTFFKP